jgi:hypothetical protein
MRGHFSQAMPQTAIFIVRLLFFAFYSRDPAMRRLAATKRKTPMMEMKTPATSMNQPE